MSVAKNARIGRPAFPVLTAKIDENSLKIFAKIQHMELYAQFPGNLFGICLCVVGIIVRIHENALTVKTIPLQQRSGGRTVHSAAQRNKNFISINNHFAEFLS
jgi:hypothetical protein